MTLGGGGVAWVYGSILTAPLPEGYLKDILLDIQQIQAQKMDVLKRDSVCVCVYVCVYVCVCVQVIHAFTSLSQPGAKRPKTKGGCG